jgi:hypothetical protein
MPEGQARDQTNFFTLIYYLLIADYNYKCAYTALIYIYKCMRRFINPSSQISCMFLLLINWGFRLFREINFLSTPDNRESTVIIDSSH